MVQSRVKLETLLLSDIRFTILLFVVEATKLDVSRSKQNRTMLHHQQRSPVCFSGVERFEELLQSAVTLNS
jgi:hypothetical protein